MWSVKKNSLNPNPITKFFVVGLLGLTVVHSIHPVLEWMVRKTFKYSIFIMIILFIVMFYLTFHTNIGIDSGFSLDMVNLKVIDVKYVFLSNLKLILVNLILGILTCGIFTVFSVIQNIHTLSVISNVLVLNNKSSYILKLLPHGIFEIFVLVFTLVTACFFSLRCIMLIKKIVQRKNDVKKEFLTLIKTLAYHTIFLIFILFVAVIIEFLVSVYV